MVSHAVWQWVYVPSKAGIEMSALTEMLESTQSNSFM